MCAPGVCGCARAGALALFLSSSPLQRIRERRTASFYQVRGTVPYQRTRTPTRTDERSLAKNNNTHTHTHTQDGAGAARADLQAVYGRLRSAPPPRAQRFLAAYTDGGTDGGLSQLHYWADSAFVPDLASPCCTDGPRDVSTVALFKAAPHAPDAARAAHRAHMVARCSAAAAVLFAPPGAAPASGRDAEARAARMLRAWSTAGLERLFADLFQDLALALAAAGGDAAAAAAAIGAGQNMGQWGRLLLSGVPPDGVRAELLRLRETFQRVVRRATLEHYRWGD